MNIPGKLREDIKRIFGRIDPLDCIEDAEMVDSREGTMVRVLFRVPRSCDRFAQSSSLYYNLGEASRMDSILNSVAGFCFEGVPEPPAPTKKKDALNFPKPERILFSGPKTIVFWPDGSKTIVSLGKDQEYDEYTAFCAAVVKKMFGATHKAKKFLDKIKVQQVPKSKKRKTEAVDNAE